MVFFDVRDNHERDAMDTGRDISNAIGVSFLLPILDLLTFNYGPGLVARRIQLFSPPLY